MERHTLFWRPPGFFRLPDVAFALFSVPPLLVLAVLSKLQPLASINVLMRSLEWSERSLLVSSLLVTSLEGSGMKADWRRLKSAMISFSLEIPTFHCCLSCPSSFVNCRMVVASIDDRIVFERREMEGEMIGFESTLRSVFPLCGTDWYLADRAGVSAWDGAWDSCENIIRQRRSTLTWVVRRGMLVGGNAAACLLLVSKQNSMMWCVQ